jgi:NAD(P)-dependent dehydrogenase (short-subunit alcohol dehydrogenase family)
LTLRSLLVAPEAPRDERHYGEQGQYGKANEQSTSRHAKVSLGSPLRLALSGVAEVIAALRVARASVTRPFAAWSPSAAACPISTLGGPQSSLLGAIRQQTGAFCQSGGAPAAPGFLGVENALDQEVTMYRTLRCDPALFEKDLNGRTYIVTGANSGAGLATVEQLVRQGAHVVAACRRVAAGKEATGHLASERGKVEVMALDLSSLASVRRFAAEFGSRHDRLDGLVNNAGVMSTPRGRTEDGFETQFGTNHLGHFLLTELLLDRLKASAPSRIVCVSSVAHVGLRGGETAAIELDDLHFEKRPYEPTRAYMQSKLAVVVYARHLAARLRGSGVSVFSVHPGWIRSNLVKHMAPTWVQNVVLRPFSGLLGMMSAVDGAQTQLHCLLDDDAPRHSGEYYSQTSVLYPDRANRAGGWPMRSPNPKVYDDDLGERLYRASRDLVGYLPGAGAPS